jgi:hypothetical protein
MRSPISTVGLFAVVALTSVQSARADILTGAITNWVDLTEGFPPLRPQAIGDGVHHVTGMWSLASWDPSDDVSDSGYLYGSVFTADTEVAPAHGITSIDQIVDASVFTFTDAANTSTTALFDAEQPSGIGDFVVLRNINSGHYGVMRIDDVYDPHLNSIGRLSARLDVTWWFQTDGSADFSIPTPSTLAIAAIAAGLTTRRRRPPSP